MPKHLKRFIAIALALTLLSAVLAGCSQGSRTTGNGTETENDAGLEPTKIVVADARTTHHLNLYVAQELGFFEKYGLDVEIIAVDDNAAARDLVVSGGADVFWSCPTVAIAAVANGAAIRSIAQVKKPCTSVLVVPPDSAITTLADLHGAEIAGISPTCEAVISLTVAARSEGAEFNLQRLAGVDFQA